MCQQDGKGDSRIHEHYIKHAADGLTYDAANIRNLFMLKLFYTCVANLAKIMVLRKTRLSDEQQHYIEKDDYNRFIYHQEDADATEMYDAEKPIELCDTGGDLMTPVSSSCSSVY